MPSFKHHLMQFTALADIAVSKGLGKSFEMSIACVQKASSRVANITTDYLYRTPTLGLIYSFSGYFGEVTSSPPD